MPVQQAPGGLLPFDEYQQWLESQEKRYLEQAVQQTNDLIDGY